MKYSFIILAFLLPFSAVASNQAIMSNFGAGLTTPGTAGYVGIGGGTSQASASTNTTPPIPYAATIQNMQAALSVAPGTGFSYAMTLFVNGLATSLACTVSNSATTCPDTTDQISVTAGENVEWKELGSSASANATAISISADVIPVNARDTWVPAVATAPSATVEEYAALTIRNIQATIISNSSSPIPSFGTFDQLQVSGANVTPGTMLNTFLQAGATTTLACTRTATSCTDTSDSVAVKNLNELDTMSFMPSSSPAVGITGFSMRFTPPLYTPNSYLILGGASGADSTAVTSYLLAQGLGVSTTTEASAQEVASAETITSLSVSISSAPGANRSRTFTLRDNGNNTALSCIIAGAGVTTCNAAGSVTVNAGDLLDISSTPSGTPAANNGDRFGMLANEIPNNVLGYCTGKGYVIGSGYIL